VAHRYKEFDSLDTRLKATYQNYVNQIPKLPKKDLFSYLDSAVVAKRRKMLEDYMAKIVLTLPAIMRSELMNSFLGISVRISTIRKKIQPAFEPPIGGDRCVALCWVVMAVFLRVAVM
jgi:hypothetical protein